MKRLLSDDELDELAFLNFTESLREFVRWNAEGTLEEHDQTLRTQTAVDFASGSFNAVTYLGSEPADADEWLAEQTLWFRARGRGFSVHTRAEKHASIARACARRGGENAARPPIMSRVAPFDGGQQQPKASVRLASSLEDWRAFADVTASAYVSMGFPEEVTRALMSSPARMRRPVWHCALASDEAGDVGAAVVLFSHSIAGLYWVGTLPRARGRGLAAACVEFLTNHAFELGARAVVLQASDAGAPLYRRLGFREFTQYPMYVLRG